MKTIIRSIIVVILLLQVPACGTQHVDQTALAFPHVVGTLPPLQVVLIVDGSDLIYRVVCLSNSQYQSVDVRFNTPNADGGTGQGKAGLVTPQGIVTQLATCTTGMIVTEDSLPSLMDMEMGSRIEITFKVVTSNGSEQQITRSYIKSEDGLSSLTKS